MDKHCGVSTYEILFSITKELLVLTTWIEHRHYVHMRAGTGRTDA